jgi:predicted nuclease of predicted toxin-antitoxin system
MKLLFDENLSPKLPRLLAQKFSGSVHVRELGFKGRADTEIFNYARDNGFTIVSKDSDFYQRILLHGSPPKFVWLCLGNCTRDELVELLTAHESDILALEASSESVLVLL